MVLLVLYVKAELENVASITFPRNLQWCFDVKDAQSDETRGVAGTTNVLPTPSNPVEESRCVFWCFEWCF